MLNYKEIVFDTSTTKADLLTARSPRFLTLQCRYALCPTVVTTSLFVELSKYGCENGCSQYGGWLSIAGPPKTKNKNQQ